MKQYTILFIVFIGLLISCKENSRYNKYAESSTKGLVLPESKSGNKDSTYVQEIIFGRFCGECSGNCAPMFRLNTSGNATTLWADYDNTYFKRNGNLEFKTDLNRQELIGKAYQVVRKLPKVLLNSMLVEKTFGCPDCADGCGIYIEFTTEPGEKPKKFKLDWGPSDRIPKVITDYAGFVDSTINEIMK